MRVISYLTLNILLLFLFNCSSKKEVDHTKYENYLYLLQNSRSGNCAVIEKNDVNGDIIYSATAHQVASGRCVESNFNTFLTDADAAKVKSDTYYNGMILSYNKYIAECGALIATGLVARDLQTVSSITTSALASSSGCVKVVPGVYYCKDTPSLDALRDSFRYHSITNAKVDMKTSLDSVIQTYAVANIVLDLKYEEAVIGNVRIANPTEVRLFNGADSNALISAFAQNGTCFKKVILGNANLKTAYSKIPTLQEFFREEINVSDRKAVTETLTPNLYCRYGTGVSALPTVGICPNTYPVF